MMIKKLLLVALGGALGSVTRYGISVLLKPYYFVLGTLTVNVAGSFLIGIIMSFSLSKNNFENWRLLLATGVCGGFTTFSAFSWECIQLFQQQKYFSAIGYITISFVLAICAAYAGFSLAKQSVF